MKRTLIDITKLQETFKREYKKHYSRAKILKDERGHVDVRDAFEYMYNNTMCNAYKKMMLYVKKNARYDAFKESRKVREALEIVSDSSLEELTSSDFEEEVDE